MNLECSPTGLLNRSAEVGGCGWLVLWVAVVCEHGYGWTAPLIGWRVNWCRVKVGPFLKQEYVLNVQNMCPPHKNAVDTCFGCKRKVVTR